MRTTKRTCKGVDESRLHVVAQGNVTMTSKGKATWLPATRLPTVRKILLTVIVLSITATFAHAGGKKDTPAPTAATAPRDISSFADITWRCDTLLETVTWWGEESVQPSTFSIWIDDDGEAAVQSNFIHWHYEPRAEVRGDTLVIITGEGEEYARFKIEGNTLIRTVVKDGVETRHIYNVWEEEE